MYILHILFKKAALSLDHGLHPASEGHAGPVHHGLSMESKFSLMEVIREALVVWARRLVCVPK
jgi:hypothetical protein